MTFKEKVYKACLSLVEEKLNMLETAYSELAEGAESDSKSSAGDKHETSRAMMQLEQEKIVAQMNEMLDQKDILDHTDIYSNLQWVGKGSLVKTDQCFLFICAALGRIRVEGIEVICLSPKSPLGKNLMGLKKGESTEVNKIVYRIEKIS
jgi:hypothetical protein